MHCPHPRLKKDTKKKKQSFRNSKMIDLIDINLISVPLPSKGLLDKCRQFICGNVIRTVRGIRTVDRGIGHLHFRSSGFVAAAGLAFAWAEKNYNVLRNV
jgi:hypothetical protein